MKKITLSILSLLTFISCNAQTNQTIFSLDNFEKEILVFVPKQNNLSDKDFNHGKMILRETKNAVENNVDNFNRADYFNILSCFLSLKESDKNIEIAFEKFKNAEGSCEYFLDKSLFKSAKYDIVRENINNQIWVCNNLAIQNSNPTNLKEYANSNGLDYKLVFLMNQIIERDKKYRTEEITDWSKQTPLDIENQSLVDSLYKTYQNYIGTSLVGEEYNYVMWTLIQHSNIDMMEKYLPIVQKATEDKELGIVPFKMLIDRIYSSKYNYQIFGSQVGVNQANEKIRQEIITKYKLK